MFEKIAKILGVEKETGMSNIFSQERLKMQVKNNFPFVETYYSKMLNSRRQLPYLLPVSIRLKKGMKLTVTERRRMVQKLYKQKEEQPLFLGKRVLLWEPAPWPIHIALVSFIGTALSLRGSQVEHVICDGTPVACTDREITNDESFQDWRKRCKGCYKACRDEAKSFDMKTEAIGDLVSPEKNLELRKIAQSMDLANIDTYSYKGVNVGGYAISSLMRYYKGQVTGFEDDLLREYLFGTLVITEAAINKIDSFKPDAVYMTHGIYNLWGPALTIAVKRGIPVIRMGGGYRAQFAYFCRIRNTTYSNTGVLSDRGWENRLKEPLSSYQEQTLENYMCNRYKLNPEGFCGVKSTSPSEDKQTIFNKLGITEEKPIWCIFAHLHWDNSANLSPMAFRDFNEWIVETVKTIIDIPDVQWLIKIHPAEKYTNTYEGVEKLIKDNFSNLPAYTKVIPADTDINTYSIFNIITGGITCMGTVGLELAAMGKPVITAADTYYSKKGFTYDALSPSVYKSYLRKITELSPVLTPEQKERARKFAYSHYIPRQIPLRMFKTGSEGRFSSFDWRKIELLLPGRDPVVDMICERFFEGDDFILDDETIHEVYKL